VGTGTLPHKKIKDLLKFFDTVDLDDTEEIKLDPATTIVGVKKFINFSKTLLKDATKVTKVNRPYILRLHRLRQYYEQKRTNT
jgi:hypothetical protein